MKNEETPIRWVTTPRCTGCTGSPELRGRAQCLGCEKLRPARLRPPRPAAPGGHCRLRMGQQARRDEKIVVLRARGLSLREIGELLGMPRSTVNNAVQRALHPAPKPGMDTDIESAPGA